MRHLEYLCWHVNAIHRKFILSKFIRMNGEIFVTHTHAHMKNEYNLLAPVDLIYILT